MRNSRRIKPVGAYVPWRPNSATELGLPAGTVHAMLVAAKQQLQSHLIRTFTFSPDPDFQARLLDIVGLYLNAPDNARCCAWT